MSPPAPRSRAPAAWNLHQQTHQSHPFRLHALNQPDCLSKFHAVWDFQSRHLPPASELRMVLGAAVHHRLEVAGYRGFNGGERTCGVRAAAAGAGGLHGEAEGTTGRRAHNRPQQPPLQLTYPVQATTTSSQTPSNCDISLSLLHGRQTQSQRP